MDLIGVKLFIAASSNDTGNTHLAREILQQSMQYLLNLPDPAHHLNNTWKDITILPYFSSVSLLFRLLELLHSRKISR